MSFRKEKKIKLSKFEFSKLKSTLIEDGMSSLYPKRVITSKYFDTSDYRMFQDSEEGVLPRKKIRVRWYDEKKIFLEIKISSIEGRFKTSNLIDKVDLINLESRGYLDRDYGLVYPKIVIEYLRSYYIYKKMRITFDENITYFSKNFHKYQKSRDLEAVVEIKTSMDLSDEYIQKNFSHITSRFSKYCRGINSLL